LVLNLNELIMATPMQLHNSLATLTLRKIKFMLVRKLKCLTLSQLTSLLHREEIRYNWGQVIHRLKTCRTTLQMMVELGQDDCIKTKQAMILRGCPRLCSARQLELIMQILPSLKTGLALLVTGTHSCYTTLST
jgi:hypothetical protein